MLNKIEKFLADNNIEVLPPHMIANGSRVLVSDDPTKIFQCFIDNKKENVDDMIEKISKIIGDKKQIQFCELILPSRADMKGEQLALNNLIMRRIVDSDMDRCDALIKIDQTARPPMTQAEIDESFKRFIEKENTA